MCVNESYKMGVINRELLNGYAQLNVLECNLSNECDHMGSSRIKCCWSDDDLGS